MKKLFSKILILAFFVSMFGLQHFTYAQTPDDEGITTELDIDNVPPSFTTGPSDGPSSATSPTNAGSNVTFSAIAHDNNADDYYLAVCKTQYAKAGNSAAPSCCTDAGLLTCTDSEKWAISAAADSDAPASVTYTTSSGSLESNVWYAFVCDYNSTGTCSAYSQGTGDAGSPFKVNHQPVLGTVKIGSECGDTAPTAPGNEKEMKVTNGVWSNNDILNSTAIQSDGKIVAAGYSTSGSNSDIALVRYNTDGSLDTSFDTDGRVTTAVGSGNDSAFSVVIQSDGKIIAAGYGTTGSNSDIALVRYNTDGSLDTSFDTDGRVTTAVGSGNDIATSVTVQSDGKIVVAGYGNTGSNNDFAVIRYNTNGSLDTSFSDDGKVTTAIGSGNDNAASVAIQGDGKIVVAGYSQNGGNRDFAAVRYNTDGSLDTSFGGDGIVTTAIGTALFSASSVAIQSDGKIVVAGSTIIETYEYAVLAVVRYNTDGSLDTSFDGDGIATTDVGGQDDDDVGKSVAIQSDGKIVVAGRSMLIAESVGLTYFTVVRYDTNGSLDTSFDTDGIATTRVRVSNLSSSSASAVAIQSDGKIVAAGSSSHGIYSDFALSRYNTNGSLDATFDHDGKVTTAFSYGYSDAYGMAIQSDGKIVLAGYSENLSYDFAVARYNTDGTLDTSFSIDGLVMTDFSGSIDDGLAVAVQGDGKIVVAGEADVGGGQFDFAVARYNTDGTLDTTFSGDGKVTTPVGPNYDYDVATGVVIQTDGKIVVTGASNNDFAAVRYNSDGTLDNTFSGDSKVTTPIGSGIDYPLSAALQSDGKIVLAGRSIIGGNNDVAVVRYNSDGTLDTGFSEDGMVTTAVGAGDDRGYSVAIQSDGKIVVAGSSNNGSNDDIAVVRYNSDGTLDTAFDTDGKVTTAVGSYSDGAKSVTIQSDGKIVAGGWSDNGSNSGAFATVRYSGTDGSLDTSFDTDGKVTTSVGGAQFAGIFSILMQTDGKIVAGGIGNGQDDEGFALVRYNTDGSVDSPADYVCVQGDVTDTDTDTTADTVEMHVCSSNSFSGGQCADTTVCKITGVRTGGHAQCIGEDQVNVPKAHGSYDLFVFTVDSHGMQGSGTSTQSYAVADVSPELVSYDAEDEPNLSAGGSDTVDFSVAFRDVNGDNDVTNLKGVFFDPVTTTRHCTSAENSCYIHASCTPTGVDAGADENLGADCTATVWFNADASDWDVEAQATDEIGVLFFNDAGVSLTNPALQGIDVVEGAIAYGTVVIGGTSVGRETSMGNVGNQILDVYISGSEMTSGSYSIPVEQQKWQHSSVTFDWDDPAAGAGPYPLVDTATGSGDDGGCLNKDIAVRTVHGTADTNESIFWKLRIPEGQEAGSYTGTNTFSTTSEGTCSTGAGY